MGCYHPIPAFQERPGLQPKLWPPLHTENLALPCGTCLGCRSAKANQWAHRCQHEASLYQHNTFLTLTYDDAHLPTDNHLDALALQRFIKRLRISRDRNRSGVQSDQNRPIRYLASGEYGEHNGRPHYHLALFNCGFEKHQRVKKDLYASTVLYDLWPGGTHTFGPFTAAAANYIAQYTIKKQGQGDHDADGVYRPPPFLRMSTHPAIGTEWLQKYKTDLQHGYLVAGGEQRYKHQIPRTYLKKLETIDPDLHDRITRLKIDHLYKNNDNENRNPERIKAQEVMHTRIKQLTENRNL